MGKTRKDFEGNETTLDGGYGSYGASSESEREIMIGSNARKRESAKYRKSVQNEIDRVLNKKG